MSSNDNWEWLAPLTPEQVDELTRAWFGPEKVERIKTLIADAPDFYESESVELEPSDQGLLGGNQMMHRMTWTGVNGQKFDEEVPDIWIAGMCSQRPCTVEQALAYWRWMSEMDAKSLDIESTI